MPISINNTTLTFNDATTQTTAGQPGTVTSVATGNGLSGGTITTTGTLVVACPTFNTVGSYCAVGDDQTTGGSTYTSGSNYAAGTGASQLVSKVLYFDDDTQGYTSQRTNNLSGTWKWMSGTSSDDKAFGIACRVS